MSAAGQPYERRFAAILAADVVGYSRLMAEDEEATLAAFNACREVIDDRIAGHRGRIFGGAGDSVIAEFASPVEAVRAAVEIQRKLQGRSDDTPEDRRIRFRIGVNLGDVMAEGPNLLGDGVNVAVRLEGLAEPGGICISAKVLEEVRTKLHLGFEDLGQQRVKNIPEPVRAYRVLLDPAQAGKLTTGKLPKAREWRWLAVAAAVAAVLVAGGVVAWLQPWHPALERVASGASEPLKLPSKPSIAVLPFANLNNDPDEELFIDGLTNDIITDLSKFSSLFVIAANSTFQYKGKAANVKDVARDLGVRYVLEGSVQRSQDTLRINAQLIDATTGTHVWAERYDREAEDFFAIQNEITHNVVGVISPIAEGRGMLLKEELQRIARTSTDNLEAYDYFIQGMFHVEHVTKEETLQARNLFEKAIQLDPSFARAYGKNTWTYLFEYAYGWTDAPERTLQKAMEVANAGIAADPNEPWAHYGLGSAYIWRKQYDLGLREFQKAHELNPNDATILADYAWALSLAGRPDDAMPLIEEALRLNPYHPRFYVADVLWRVHFVAGRYKEALDALLSVSDPYPPLYQRLAATYPYLDRMDEARAALAKFRELEPQASIELYTREPYKRRDDLERFLDGLRKAGLPEKSPAPGT